MSFRIKATNQYVEEQIGQKTVSDANNTTTNTSFTSDLKEYNFDDDDDELYLETSSAGSDPHSEINSISKKPGNTKGNSIRQTASSKEDYY